MGIDRIGAHECPVVVRLEYSFNHVAHFRVLRLKDGKASARHFRR